MGAYYSRRGKRTLDIALAIFALIGTSPILAVATLAVFVEDRNSPIFRHQRVGTNGCKFTIYKLRSMRVDTVELESRSASGLQVTRVGTVIRRLSVDELPQLFNVLRGDMSLVGPRPALLDQYNLIRLREESGAIRVQPGMTGAAQVNSYDDMPEEDKARHDGLYAKNITLWRDLKIMGQTVVYLLKPPPTY